MKEILLLQPLLKQAGSLHLGKGRYYYRLSHVLDAPDLTILPAFEDTHNHLILAAQNMSLVPVVTRGCQVGLSHFS